MDYLSLCLIARDENTYIQEWLDYHILLGVERFYIYDNESRVNLREILKEYIDKGWVIVTDVIGKAQQLFAYDHCLGTYGANSKWIGFIDTDEFIVPKMATDLKEFLKEYENYAGFVLSSTVFGSSGHVARPIGGQIVSYRHRIHLTSSINKSTKSILQPGKVDFPLSPHSFGYKMGNWAVNEKFWRVDGQNFPSNTDKIQLNHYFFRSESEFLEKYSRGRGDGGEPYKTGMFARYRAEATYEDMSILTLLKKILAVRQVTGWDEENLFNPDKPALLDLMHDLAARQSPVGKVTPVPGNAEPRREMFEYNESIEELKHFIANKNWESARSLQKKIIAKNPNLIVHYTNIEQTYFDQGLFDEAWEILQKARAISSDSFLVMITLGTYYLRKDDFIHTEETCRELLVKAPYEALLLLGLAWSLINLNKYEEAIEHVFTAIENNRFLVEERSTVDIINRIGVYMYKRGDTQRAVSLFEWALVCNPEDPDLLVNLGKVYYDNKNYQRARELLQKVKELNPADEEATMGLNLIDRIIGRAA